MAQKAASTRGCRAKMLKPDFSPPGHEFTAISANRHTKKRMTGFSGRRKLEWPSRQSTESRRTPGSIGGEVPEIRTDAGSLVPGFYEKHGRGRCHCTIRRSKILPALASPACMNNENEPSGIATARSRKGKCWSNRRRRRGHPRKTEQE